MTLIDTHTHLESFAARGEVDAIVASAQAAGVSELVAIGTSPDDWALYGEMAAQFAGIVHYTVGLHPCSVNAGWRLAVEQIGAFWSARAGHVGPVGLGEGGLDRFHLPKNDVNQAERILGWQRAAFAAQLEIARQSGCPVVVHSRGAFAECVEMIDASGVDWSRVVFHCFTEGVAEMAELMRRGGFGSFTGVLSYKSAENVRAAALAQGLGRLMLETDAPYLTPMPHRGKPNEPAYLRHTAEFAAGVFGVTVDELARVSTANARNFFRL